MNLAHDLAMALDPTHLMRRAGFEPDPWQSDFLRSTAPRELLLCARQTGNSTATGVLATHTAVYEASAYAMLTAMHEEGALVLLLAPSQNQSRELFRKVAGFYRLIGTVDADAESAQRIELANGSRIVSLSGNPDTVRGYSGPRLVIMDEAAWIEDDLYHAVTPMLAAGGRLVAMTTPFGKRGWFWDAWENGGDAWRRTRVTADDSPRITPEFLRLERATKPEWRIRQEYFCEFVDTDEQLFGTDLISAALSPSVAPLFDQPFAW